MTRFSWVFLAVLLVIMLVWYLRVMDLAHQYNLN
jgi:hypothetical protein